MTFVETVAANSLFPLKKYLVNDKITIIDKHTVFKQLNDKCTVIDTPSRSRRKSLPDAKLRSETPRVSLTVSSLTI